VICDDGLPADGRAVLGELVDDLRLVDVEAAK
jgi:hypothetical protein